MDPEKQITLLSINFEVTDKTQISILLLPQWGQNKEVYSKIAFSEEHELSLVAKL